MQKLIQKNAEYFRSIEMLGGRPILRVWYPEKWGVYPSADEKIKVTRSETTANEWFYYSTDENISIEDMFALLEQTVNVNLSAIAKIDLLKAKMTELKEFFSNHSLEELERMKFVIEAEGSTKPKRKTSKKKKTETEEIKEETTENDV